MPGASAGFGIVGEMDLTSSFYASDQSGTDKDPYLLINLKQQGLLHLKESSNSIIVLILIGDGHNIINMCMKERV